MHTDGSAAALLRMCDCETAAPRLRLWHGRLGGGLAARSWQLVRGELVEARRGDCGNCGDGCDGCDGGDQQEARIDEHHLPCK